MCIINQINMQKLELRKMYWGGRKMQEFINVNTLYTLRDISRIFLWMGGGL